MKMNKYFILLALVVLVSAIYLIFVGIENQSRTSYYYISNKELTSLIPKGENGDTPSCWRLHFYYEDIGDATKAEYWLQKAASYGDPKALLFLSHIEKRKNNPQSQKKAVELLKQSAEKGYADAIEELKKTSEAKP